MPTSYVHIYAPPVTVLTQRARAHFDITESYDVRDSDAISDPRNRAYNTATTAIATFASMIWGVDQWFEARQQAHDEELREFTQQEKDEALVGGLATKAEMYEHMAMKMLADVAEVIQEVDKERKYSVGNFQSFCEPS